ncbi:sensor histidine kinase [Thalassomonas actiniarum]|uniref:histidine kinase n=1 Tax=Thalassomonas actiniarum TaxID=485447 RepID=A0AAE9YSW3_9GAMM|nr:ATP-binding protein [Thalassomonas actiniarum]WDE00486.1 PAS domain-containing sensor histidine kinase [Thalassomonas actiniarum]
MAVALHKTTENFFNQSDVSFHYQRNALQQEAYPGELEQLRQQSGQYGQIIDVMPTGMVMLDGDGVVVKINKVARLLLDEPILGQPWFDVIRRSFKPRADDWHEVSLKDGRRVKLEITTLGDQPGQLIMITDLTETRLLQDKMAQMQRLSSLGRMVSSLAHQIRTPLSAAMLYGANLSNGKLNDQARDNFQSKLMSRLQDLEQQVNDMLLFAKSGKEQVVNALSVNDIIEESVAGIDVLAIKEKAQISVLPCEGDCQILGNKTALSGAIQNLIHNSLQVIEQQGEITIASRCTTSHALISVRDNGPGISKAQATKIFEPFYTSKVHGTGLGLAVVKAVANAHHGSVHLISSPGEGANFCLKIPLLANQPQGQVSVTQAQPIERPQEAAL